MRNSKYINEDKTKDELDSKLIKRLLQYLRPHAFGVCVIILLLFVIAFLNLIGPYIIKLAVDGPMQTGDVKELAWLSFLFLLSMLGSSIAVFFQMITTQKIGQSIMHLLRMQLFTHIQGKNVSSFHKSRVGDLVTRIVGDVDVLTELFSFGIVSIFSSFLTVIGIVFALFLLSPSMACLIFFLLTPAIPLTIFFRNRIRACFRSIRGNMSAINAFIQEHIVGIEVVKLFSREELNDKNFDVLNKKYLDSYLDTIFYYAILLPSMELVGAFTIAIVLWYGGERVFAGTVTFGVMVAFIEYFQKFFRPVKDLVEKYNIIQSGLAAAERIFHLIDSRENDDQVDDGEAFLGEVDTISFENVSFHYREDQPVLKNVSCRIKKGEKIAIVGPTGAGKSTFVHMICRFYNPVSGRITFNGRDVCKLKKKEVREKLGLVLQEPFLFSGSLRDNITLHNSNIDKESIERAMSVSGACGVAQKLDGGLDSKLAERGENISIGERQLLSFAQALVHDPSVLILDEATAHIDSQSEYVIETAMKNISKNRTMIVIAHRFSTIMGADRIFVFWGGELVEQGSHAELMKGGKVYRKFYELQYSQQELGTI